MHDEIEMRSMRDRLEFELQRRDIDEIKTRQRLVDSSLLSRNHAFTPLLPHEHSPITSQSRTFIPKITDVSQTRITGSSAAVDKAPARVY